MKPKHTVLAVDDENDVLLVVKTALQAEGYNVLTAPDGLEALKIAVAETPDLIILDIMMPEMDGFEVLKKLRENEETVDIPVIMLTGLSERDNMCAAIERGTKYYIVKPFEFQDLIAKVRAAIKDAQTGDIW